MHISDGVLSREVLVATGALAVGAVAWGLRRLDYDRVPRVGVLASVFFVASLIHVRMGPSSVHLILNGLLGLLLGRAVFPALAVALFLQAILLGFGGLTALGANIVMMGAPAVLAWAVCARPCRRAASPAGAFAWGAAAGGGAVLLSGLLMAALLHLSNAESYDKAAVAVLVAHLPVVVVEAGVTGAAAAFFRRVRPELLDAPLRPAAGGEA